MLLLVKTEYFYPMLKSRAVTTARLFFIYFLSGVYHSNIICYYFCMNTILQTVLSEVERLPDIEQEALASQIEELIIARRIAASEADIAAGKTTPLGAAFVTITSNLTTKYGNRSST